MRTTILAIGLGSLLLAACAADPAATGDRTVAREEGYIPTGSNIPRRDPKRSDMPSVTDGQLGAIMRGAGPARAQ